MRLKDKVAIVTGAATGIGEAIAAAFVNEGAAVVIDYVGKSGSADESVGKLKAAGGQAIGIEADVSDAAQVQSLIDQTVSTFGRVDILVNNAGIEFKRPFVDFPLDLWQKIMAVDLTGPFLCAQTAARQMIKQGGGGRIINISSVHEDLPCPRMLLLRRKGIADADAHDRG